MSSACAVPGCMASRLVLDTVHPCKMLVLQALRALYCCMEYSYRRDEDPDVSQTKAPGHFLVIHTALCLPNDFIAPLGSLVASHRIY